MPEPGSPGGEVAVLVAVQSALADKPGVLTVARGMSHFGEHSIGWLAVSALGALLQPARRRQWITAGAGSVFWWRSTPLSTTRPLRATVWNDSRSPPISTTMND